VSVSALAFLAGASAISAMFVNPLPIGPVAGSLLGATMFWAIFALMWVPRTLAAAHRSTSLSWGPASSRSSFSSPDAEMIEIV
jgi:hypothetical protein